MLIFAISELAEVEAIPCEWVVTYRAPSQREASSTVDSVNVVNPIAARRVTAIRTGQLERHS